MEDAIVAITNGKLKGKTLLDFKGGKYYSFQAIPYAKKPLGELRFKAPQPPESWDGVKDATKESSESLSQHAFFYHIVGSEDCLYLNVYTPQLPNAIQTPKPVMVFIHGGIFTMGSSKIEVYGPDYLMTGDVVLVTFNYRLGILGCLSLEDSSLNVPGNNNFKDMVQALKWVKNNIHVFNGDPNNITLFGQSAGGAAVHLLMLSPMAQGLFHRAIMQSGCCLNQWTYGKRCAKNIARAMNFDSENEKDILHMLKSVPAKEILKAQEKIYDTAAADSFRELGFVIEKPSNTEPSFLTECPLDIIKSGRYNKVPLLIGYTDKESLMKEAFKEFKLFSDFECKVPAYFHLPKGSDLSKQVANKIKQFYFNGSNPSAQTMDSHYDMDTDFMFLRGIYTTLKYHLKNCNEKPAYFYRFSFDGELNFFKKINNMTQKGVAHCDDLGYIFKTTILPTFKHGSIEDLVVQRMVRLWSNFARTGNPNPITEDTLIDVAWKPAKTNKLYFLDIGERLTEGTNPEKERMAFWDEISAMSEAAKDL